MQAKGGKPSRGTPADRRLRENRDKPPRDAPKPPVRPSEPAKLPRG